MPFENFLLYDRYEISSSPFIRIGPEHNYSYRAECWIYIPCAFCKYISINELMPGMVYCSKKFKPHDKRCYNFESDRSVSIEFENL